MITIHPADGLIKRLLQQQNPQASSPASPDAASISSATHSEESGDPAVKQHGSERELEAQLLQLYRANVRTKGKP